MIKLGKHKTANLSFWVNLCLLVCAVSLLLTGIEVPSVMPLVGVLVSLVLTGSVLGQFLVYR
jgi:hypothetical protein